MKEEIEMVREFHKGMGSLPPLGFLGYNHPSRKLRRDLITEEFLEFLIAEKDGDIISVADALADLLYVIYGTAIEYNIPLDKVFNEVHRSNMTKFKDGKKDERGKWIKGPSYTPPNLEQFFTKQEKEPRFLVFDDAFKLKTEKIVDGWEAAIAYKLHLLNRKNHGEVYIENISEMEEIKNSDEVFCKWVGQKVPKNRLGKYCLVHIIDNVCRRCELSPQITKDGKTVEELLNQLQRDD